MSTRSRPDLRLELRPSRTVFVAACAGHLIAWVVLARFAVLPPAVSLAVAGLVGVSLLQRVIEYRRPRVTGMRITPDDECWLEFGAAQPVPARLVSRYVRCRFVALRFSTDQRLLPYALLVTSDNTDADTLRGLRVRLLTRF